MTLCLALQFIATMFGATLRLAKDFSMFHKGRRDPIYFVEPVDSWQTLAPCRNRIGGVRC